MGRLIQLTLWVFSTLTVMGNVPTLDQLLSMSPEELETVDVAVMNFRCAEGLPGSKTVHFEKVLSELDQIADYIRSMTTANMHLFYQDSAAYQNNESLFKMSLMQSLLERNCGIIYSPYRANDEPAEIFFADSKDIFLTGFTNRQERMGTCASLPVLYTAIGRRLGYPLELIQAKNHLLFRWEGKGVRFNCDVSGDGMSTPPDEHFTSEESISIAKLNKEEIDSGIYLTDLSARQCLSIFMVLRGVCYNVNGMYREANKCYGEASRLMPECSDTKSKFEQHSQFIQALKK